MHNNIVFGNCENANINAGIGARNPPCKLDVKGAVKIAAIISKPLKR